MFELDYIRIGLWRMLVEPEKFFKDIKNKDLDLRIPVIAIFLAGIIMAIIVISQIPAMEHDWKITGTDQLYNKAHLLKVEKTKAILYPFWCILFWFIFTLSLAFLTAVFGGSGNFKQFFNCTSFVAYPFVILQFIRFFLMVLPKGIGNTIYMFLLLIVIIWAFFLLIKVAIAVGSLDSMHGFVVAIIPSFFLSLLWISYVYIIMMFLINGKKALG